MEVLLKVNFRLIDETKRFGLTLQELDMQAYLLRMPWVHAILVIYLVWPFGLKSKVLDHLYSDDPWPALCMLSYIIAQLVYHQFMFRLAKAVVRLERTLDPSATLNRSYLTLLLCQSVSSHSAEDISVALCNVTERCLDLIPYLVLTSVHWAASLLLIACLPFVQAFHIENKATISYLVIFSFCCNLCSSNKYFIERVLLGVYTSCSMIYILLRILCMHTLFSAFFLLYQYKPVSNQ